MADTTTKQCKSCKQEKPLSVFVELDILRGIRYRNHCSECRLNPVQETDDDEGGSHTGGLRIDIQNVQSEIRDIQEEFDENQDLIKEHNNEALEALKEELEEQKANEKKSDKQETSEKENRAGQEKNSKQIHTAFNLDKKQDQRAAIFASDLTHDSFSSMFNKDKKSAGKTPTKTTPTQKQSTQSTSRSQLFAKETNTTETNTKSEQSSQAEQSKSEETKPLENKTEQKLDRAPTSGDLFSKATESQAAEKEAPSSDNENSQSFKK